jgi:hypothetical protein
LRRGTRLDLEVLERRGYFDFEVAAGTKAEAEEAEVDLGLSVPGLDRTWYDEEDEWTRAATGLSRLGGSGSTVHNTGSWFVFVGLIVAVASVSVVGLAVLALLGEASRLEPVNFRRSAGGRMDETEREGMTTVGCSPSPHLTSFYPVVKVDLTAASGRVVSWPCRNAELLLFFFFGGAAENQNKVNWNHGRPLRRL